MPTPVPPRRRVAILSRGAAPRGQSLVEFALVLPVLLILLLGVADFGRIFSAGIVVEASARNAADAAAQEYLQLKRNVAPLTSADYSRVHAIAIQSACEEAERLPNRVGTGTSCTMPAVAVCIHDDAAELPGYSGCGQESAGAAPECSRMQNAWSAGLPYGNALPYVEVRVCYEFTTLFNLTNLELPFGWSISFGTIYLERDRTFTVACYQSATGTCV